MTRRLAWKKPLSICILAAWAPGGPAGAQCPADDWTLFAATGDVAEIEIWNNTAWIAAQGGLISLDLTTVAGGNAVQRKVSDAEGLISPDITAMALDGFGNVWVGTRTSGVSVFDPSGVHIRNIATSAKDAVLWSENVLAIATFRVSADTSRVVVASADTFSPGGNPEGGGFMILLVTRDGAGFRFQTVTGVSIPNNGVVADVFLEADVIWLGTAGQGVFRVDLTASPLTAEQDSVLVPGNGVLLSGNVRHVLRAPDADHAADVLWLGSAAGLQRYDGAALDTVAAFNDRQILDLYYREGDDDLYVVAERTVSPGVLDRDTYRVDLTVSADSIRIPRSGCFADTTYVPRDVAVDGAGRLVLGTRRVAYAIREGTTWYCPPPLGPHSPTIADLVLAPDGTLYFGTGRKDRTVIGNGVGIFDNRDWRFVTTPLLLDRNMTEVAAWPDSTVWFGSTVNLNSGGVNRYFPYEDPPRVTRYHDDVQIPDQITQGRNVWALELDSQTNLWICYGQNPGGGLSVVEWPTLDVTNYDFVAMGFAGHTLLRDIAFDSRDRVWVSTFNDASRPGQIYVVDTKRTVHDQSDDVLTQFNVATDVNDQIGEIPSITIDSADRIWLAGRGALVVGQIGPDGAGGRATVTWETVRPTASQLGGRNPLPYTTAHLDWDGNIWLGTRQFGLVRVTPDRSVWTWFDATAECPLPDPAVEGLHIEFDTRQVYVGTANQGIAVIDLSGGGGGSTSDVDPGPFPNPWKGNGDVQFGGIPLEETTTMRIYTMGGELVREVVAPASNRPKSWDGRNLGNEIVESGIYLVRARSTNGRTYEGKVAVVR